MTSAAASPPLTAWDQHLVEAAAWDLAPGWSGKDINALVKEDHEHLRQLYRAYNDAATSARERCRLAQQLISSACIHSSSEDLVLLPAVRERAGSTGEAAARAMLAQHVGLERQLAALQAMLSAGSVDPNFDGCLQDFMEELEAHMRDEEESGALPHLHTVAERMQLGRLFTAAKLIAPSRPHPAAPKQPPLVLAAACVLAAPLDLARNLLQDVARALSGGA